MISDKKYEYRRSDWKTNRGKDNLLIHTVIYIVYDIRQKYEYRRQDRKTNTCKDMSLLLIHTVIYIVYDIRQEV